MCALARTRPLFDHQGWFDSLAELLKAGGVKKRDAEPLRLLALERLMLPEPGGRSHEAAILAALMPARERFDLYVGIVRTSIEDDGAAYQAGSALCSITPSTEIDGLIRALLKELYEARAFGKLASLISRLGDQGRVGARKMAEKALATLEDEDAIAYLQACAYMLRRNGRLSNDWVMARLAEPESFGFQIAVAVADAENPKTRARLHELLESPARDGDGGGGGGNDAGSAAASAAKGRVVVGAPPRSHSHAGARRSLVRISSVRRVRPLRLQFIEPLIRAPRPTADTVLPLLEELQGSRAGERFLRELQPLATNDEVRAELSVRCGPTEQSAWTPTKEDRRRSSQRVDS